MSTLQVDIVSAEEQLYAGRATMVIAPAAEGDVGIAPRHAPLLTRLRPGELRITPEGDEEEFFFYASGGLLEVQPHKVTVLADTAVRARDIDEAAALEAKRRAEEKLREQKDEVDYSSVQAELAEAMAQLRTLESLRKRAKR
ncbi:MULTISPECIES: F0F1 ATP synthase subunit epsilon [unclassified Halorhodospira]|uniref:F0F1 ATP synthase subunit epsilon n=1 Tax=unclassified Halorhodospira TaxID=2626748 RepID=UPI001EE8A11E|nr:MULTISPECIES: F0F1 ATP synthase subunit epsilon [unclassified Halorhodospira]MCG5540793.1 F0F1 ATP synthase subunit epsilon [Halorhodospira sp. M39old]MCG5546033.1 F0F1 ATP synthase subunit epsilon [Halorhodospira sp. M38]